MIFRIIILLIFFTNFLYALENRILFKINNEVLTTIDLYNETQYLKSINKNLQNLEEEKLFEIAKNSLIREKIKKIELSKIDGVFNIKDEYLEKLINNYSKNNGFNSIEEFKKFIKDNNLNFLDVKNKIKIEILWNQLIVSKHLKDIRIDKKQIEDSINKFQNEFLLSEIVFNVDNSKNFKDKLKLIKKDIEEKGFINASVIHGISDAAKEGGRLGWIKESSLNPKIREQITKIKVGNYTTPIVIPGGFLILFVEDKRKIERVFDLEKEINLIIKEKTNELLNRYSVIYFNKIKKNIIINEL